MEVDESKNIHLYFSLHIFDTHYSYLFLIYSHNDLQIKMLYQCLSLQVQYIITYNVLLNAL